MRDEHSVDRRYFARVITQVDSEWCGNYEEKQGKSGFGFESVVAFNFHYLLVANRLS